jgi:hypothetical protein
MMKKTVRLSKRREGGGGEGGAGFNAILPKLLARQKKKKIVDNLQVKLSHVSHFKVLTYG